MIAESNPSVGADHRRERIVWEPFVSTNQLPVSIFQVPEVLPMDIVRPCNRLAASGAWHFIHVQMGGSNTNRDEALEQK